MKRSSAARARAVALPIVHILGVVRDRRRRPIPTAVVTARGLSVTGHGGGFIALANRRGTYAFTARAPGYLPQTVRIKPAGDRPVALVFSLQAAPIAESEPKPKPKPARKLRVAQAKVLSASR